MGQMAKVGRTATSKRQEDGWTVIKYHQTDVVSFNKNLIILDTGGWYTATTKTRMNQASNEYGLGYQVYQEKGKWFVVHKNQLISFDKSALVIKRQEG